MFFCLNKNKIGNQTTNSELPSARHSAARNAPLWRSSPARQLTSDATPCGKRKASVVISVFVLLLFYLSFLGFLWLCFFSIWPVYMLCVFCVLNFCWGLFFELAFCLSYLCSWVFFVCFMFAHSCVNICSCLL